MPKIAQFALAGVLALACGFGLVWALVPADVVIVQTPAPVVDDPATRSTPVERNDPVAREQPAKPRPAIAQPDGTGVIRGVARFRDGSPCAGLELLAEPEIEGLWGSMEHMAMTPDQRSETYRGYIEALKTRSLRGSTGGDGRFALRGAGEGKYHLYSHTRTRPLSERPVVCHAGDDLVIYVERAVFVDVKMKLSTGDEIESSGLSISGDGYNHSGSWRKGTPVEARPGTMKFSAGHSRDGVSYRAVLEVEVPEQGFDGPLSMTLEPDMPEGLLVKLNTPKPYFSGLQTAVIPADKAATGWPRTLYELTEAGYDTSGWRNPFPVVQKLEPGEYVVLVYLHPGDFLVRQPVYYRGGYQEEPVNVPEASREDCMLVKVRDAKGRPVTDANVSINAEGNWNQARGLVMHRGDGEYWIKCLAPEKFFFGSYRTADNYVIRAEHAAHGKRLALVPVSFRGELEIKFGPDSTLVVHLDGLPADASQFSLTAMAAGDQEERYRAPGEAPKISKTDARNEYTLQPGKIVVQLRAKGPVGDSFGVLLARHEIELGDEPQEFRIQVPALSDMRLVAPEDYPRGWLRLFGDPFVHSAPQLTPDKQRRIVFKNLPPGEYILRGPLGQMTVRMPQAEETVIGGTPFNGWMVGRCDDSNIMGTFDLRQGDIIREVNGKPAAEKGTSPYWPAFARLTGDGDITLKVQRNGSWVTLTTTADVWKTMKGYWMESVYSPD